MEKWRANQPSFLNLKKLKSMRTFSSRGMSKVDTIKAKEPYKGLYQANVSANGPPSAKPQTPKAMMLASTWKRLEQSLLSWIESGMKRT